MSLLLLGALMEAGFLRLATWGDLRGHLYGLFIIYGGLFLLLLLAWRHAAKFSSRPFLILLFALLFPLTLLPTTPSLSDDIYRYSWEGRAQRAGISPYEYPPSAPELVFLRDSVYPL